MTAAMSLCQVASGEDFTVAIVADRKLATLDATFVACGRTSDARVRIVTQLEDATEFVYQGA